MPTPSEKKALAFVAVVILLGGAARIVKAGAVVVATPAEQQALDGQIAAVDQAAQAGGTRTKQGKESRRVSRSRRDTVPTNVAGIVSVPPTFARPDDPFSHTPYRSGASNRFGYPPPGPRIDIGPVGQEGAGVTLATAGRAGSSTRTVARAEARIDLDVASIEEIERLPRVGPALARRIISNRDSLGPFRTLEALRRVKGIGPATVDRLATLVSFSGRTGPTSK